MLNFLKYIFFFGLIISILTLWRWWIALIFFFNVKSEPVFLVLNPTWLWCIISSIYCWIQFAKILHLLVLSLCTIYFFFWNWCKDKSYLKESVGKYSFCLHFSGKIRVELVDFFPLMFCFWNLSAKHSEPSVYFMGKFLFITYLNYFISMAIENTYSWVNCGRFFHLTFFSTSSKCPKFSFKISSICSDVTFLIYATNNLNLFSF